MNNLDFALETIEYFNNNPLAVCEEGNPSYFTEEGHMCAIGRIMKNPEKFKNDYSYIDSLLNIHGPEILHEEYRSVQRLVLEAAQEYHDTLVVKQLANGPAEDKQTLIEIARTYDKYEH